MAFIHSVNVNIHDNCPSFVFSEMCSVSRVIAEYLCVVTKVCGECQKSKLFQGNTGKAHGRVHVCIESL